MTDGKNNPAPPDGIGADTSIRINVKHVLMALVAVGGMGWGLAKYFYEQTHKDIDEVKDEVEQLEKKFDELDKRIDGHDVKISAWESKKEASQRLALKTGMDEEEANEAVGFEEFESGSSRRWEGTRPFVEGAAGRRTRSAFRDNERRDQDGDGVPDGFDQCPDERETWNSYEDDDGCPDSLPKMVAPQALEDEESTFRDSFKEGCTEEDFAQRFSDVCKECAAATTDIECEAAWERGMERIAEYETEMRVLHSQRRLGVSYESGLDGFGNAYSASSGRWSRRIKRAERREKRQRNRWCRRAPESCVVIQLDGHLDAASRVLSELQNTEADLRD